MSEKKNFVRYRKTRVESRSYSAKNLTLETSLKSNIMNHWNIKDCTMQFSEVGTSGIFFFFTIKK